MPTYEFRCPDGTIVERVFKMSEVPDAIPSPNGEGMATRIISGGAGLLFKGSGFYITDYGKDGKKDARERAESASKSAEGAKSEGTKTEGTKEGAKADATKSESAGKADTEPASKKSDAATSDSKGSDSSSGTKGGSS